MCVMSAMGAMCDKRFISEVSDIVYSIGLILHVLPVAKYEHTIDSSIDAAYDSLHILQLYQKTNPKV